MTWSAILFLRSLFLTMSFAVRCRARWDSSRRTRLHLPAKLNASYQTARRREHAAGADSTIWSFATEKRVCLLQYRRTRIRLRCRTSSLLSVQTGRLLISKEFAAELGRPSDAGAVVGQISIHATMRPIEITQVVDGEVTSDVLPADGNPNAGTVPGPDVIVGDLSGLAQFGSSGTQVGLAVGTDSCNFGTVDLNWFANPNNDHPVIPQNLYRMSGGAAQR